MNHTKETDDTKFIRAATGRGSIKRGPAPTKASVLRQQVILLYLQVILSIQQQKDKFVSENNYRRREN